MTRNRRNRLKPPSILDFQDRFATEEACVQFLFERRWPKGWACPRCGATKCYPIESRRLYECSACRYQVSVTAGTVLHKTRTSLRLWFLAIYFVTLDKRGISSVGLAKQLGIFQKKAWCMLHKIRQAMGKRNGRDRLDGLVELDEIMIGDPKEGGRRIRGKAKNRVLVGLSVSDQGKPRHLRFAVLEHGDRKHLERAIEAMVAPGARVRTNGLRGYLSLGGKGFAHERVIAREAVDPNGPAWRQVAVSNARAMIGGTYHGLDRLGGKHLQAYLEEYAYRFCRRHRPDLIFASCVAAVAACPIWTYRDIVGRNLVHKRAS